MKKTDGHHLHDAMFDELLEEIKKSEVGFLYPLHVMEWEKLNDTQKQIFERIARKIIAMAVGQQV